MASGPSRSAAIRAFFRKCLVDAAVQVRVDQRPELFVLPAAVVGQALGKLVEHRQARQDDQAVADVAGDGQFRLEYAGRRFLGLGRDLDHEAVGPGRQRAPDLDEDVRGVGLLGEDVGFVDQNAGRLRSGDDVGVGGLDLQGRAAAAVGDGFQVPLELEQLSQFWIRVDDPRRLPVGDAGDFHGRRDQQELGVWPAVDDHRRDHHRRGVARFAVLLRDLQEQLLDHPSIGLDIVGAEQRRHDVSEPVAGGVRHAGLADDVWQFQPVEDADGLVPLFREQRQVRDE
jgi:hypothetical protein